MRRWDHWKLLRSGKVQQGLQQLKASRPSYSDASWIKELGVAYLWIGEFGSASEHFGRAIKFHPRTNDAFYGMLGIAEWCKGEYDKAVKHWQEGLGAAYAGSAGLGIGLPLLLYAAAVLRPTAYGKTAAIELLRERERDSRIRIWPGPIARWLLGSISQSEVESLCEGADHSETQDRLWQVEFYTGIEQYRAGNRKEASQAMTRVSDTSAADWSTMETFVDRLWCEEFFLARHEASHLLLKDELYFPS